MPRPGSHRPRRMAALVQQELAEILRRRVKDPWAQRVLVTAVELSGDLRHARVFVQAPAEGRDEALRALRRAAGFLRAELGERLALRQVPELEFREDEALERGMRVYDLLQSLDEEGPANPPETGDR